MTSISDIRSSKNDPEIWNKLIDDIDSEDPEEIDIPNRDQLYTDKVDVPEGADQIWINGRGLHVMYARLVNQLNNGESPIIIIVGKEGLGKSMTALVVAQTLHDINVLSGDFNPEDQTVYDVLEFLFKVRSSTREFIMIEEANEAVNVNDYHSNMNRAVASALRTQRKRENVYGFVAPELQKIDKRIREKADIVLDLKKKQFAKVTGYRMKHGKRESRGKDYRYTNYPAYIVPDVDEDLKDEYERIDNKFKGRYLDEMLENVIEERLEEIKNEKTAEV